MKHVSDRSTLHRMFTQTEAWSLCTPLFNQLIQNALIEWNGPPLKQVLLRLAECHFEHNSNVY